MDELVRFLCAKVGKEKADNIPVQVTRWKSQEAKGRYCFIDGGNLSLYESGTTSVHLIRVASVHYTGLKRLSTRKREFYACTCNQGDRFGITTFPEQDWCGFTISIKDPELRLGSKDAEISLINPLLRRMAELRHACEAEADWIILDGSLETRHAREQAFMKTLADTCRQKGIRLAALAKTLSSGQTNLLHSLRSQPGAWSYQHADQKGYSTFLLRFHEHSDHVFNVDTDSEPGQLFNFLSQNSADPVFQGYPYGLILADRLARVSKQEAGILRTQLMVKMRTAWKDLKLEESSTNAHAILDSIS